MMMVENDRQIQDSNYYLDKSTVHVWFSLRVVIWRSKTSIFEPSFVQDSLINCIASVGETLLALIWERTFKPHCLLVLSSGYKKSIHRKIMEDFAKCKSDSVTGHHPWL